MAPIAENTESPHNESTTIICKGYDENTEAFVKLYTAYKENPTNPYAIQGLELYIFVLLNGRHTKYNTPIKTTYAHTAYFISNFNIDF